MPRKIWWLAVCWLIAGCAPVCWKNTPLEPILQQDGWKTVYYKKIIDNYELFIFLGQSDKQPKMMLFCSNDPYRQSWDKIIIHYTGDKISQFTFTGMANGQYIIGYSEEIKKWQNSWLNSLREEKNLKELPTELKNKIRQALQFGDNKYGSPTTKRTF